MMPKRQTINIKGTHCIEHDLHGLDSLSPRSYHYLEPKRVLAAKKGLARKTIDVCAMPVDKTLNYHSLEDKRSAEKSPYVRHILDTKNDKLV